MQLSQSILWVAYLSIGVLAFYPYRHGRETSGNRSGSDKLKSRFLPWRLEEDPGDVSYASLTAELRRVPMLRRDNDYKIITGEDPTAAHSLAINEDGSDYSYFSIINFGSEKKEMWMLLDTGGTNSWVFGSGCSSPACLHHNTFGSRDSTSLTVTTTSWEVGYGTGKVSGNLANDTVSFASFSIPLTFGLASSASDDFLYYPMDGILGLGRSSSSETGIPTVMSDLAEAKYLKSNIIGVSLQRDSDAAKDGEITFGNVDSSKFIGNITYTNASSAVDLWQIPVDDVGVDGKLCNLKGKSAIIDTGTSFILLPPNDASVVHALIPGSSPSGEDFIVPCNSTPVVQFTFSGITYGITPKDYIGRPVNSGPNCISNIVGHQAFGPDDWLLGDAFLKNVYSVFDYDNNRIGFAGNDAALPPIRALSAVTTNETSTTTSTAGTAGSASALSSQSKTDGPAQASASPSSNDTGANIFAHPWFAAVVLTSMFLVSPASSLL